VLPLATCLILHRTLLPRTAGQWKFALSGTELPGKGPRTGRNAGSTVVNNEPLGA